MATRVRYIRLNYGYVESQTCAVLELYHDEGFSARHRAIRAFVQVLWDHYRTYVLEDSGNRCCWKHLEEENPKKFCPDCGTKLVDDEWPSRFFNYIYHLHGGDNNSTGSLWFESLNPNGWEFQGEPFGIKKSEALCITEYGAEALFLSAYKIKWGNDRYKQQFIDYVTGDGHELPYWWWQKDKCNRDIKKFERMINQQKI